MLRDEIFPKMLRFSPRILWDKYYTISQMHLNILTSLFPGHGPVLLLILYKQWTGYIIAGILMLCMFVCTDHEYLWTCSYIYLLTNILTPWQIACCFYCNNLHEDFWLDDVVFSMLLTIIAILILHCEFVKIC